MLDCRSKHGGLTIGHRGKQRREQALERYFELRPLVLAELRGSFPADLRAKYETITLHQLQALMQLPEDGCTMYQLAGALKVTGPTASALADRLVAQGLVERDRDPADRRVVRLVPSSEGRTLAGEHREVLRNSIVALLERLCDTQLYALLDAMETLVRDPTDRCDEPGSVPDCTGATAGIGR
jgi:DNA-binding MarR family transcriptional regulator